MRDGLDEGSVTLVEVAERRARTEGPEIAFSFLGDGDREPVQVTCAGLDRRARAIARLLHEHGGTDARALLLYPSGLEFVEAFFGCLYAGIVAVPVYPPDPLRPELTVSRLAGIAADADTAFVLTTTAFAGAARTLGDWAQALRRLRWLATDVSENENGSDWRPVLPNGPDTLAFLQYTSGSTDTPKGVMVTHRNLVENATLCQGALQAQRHDVMVSWLPLCHDMGLIGTVLYPFHAGFRSVHMSPRAFLQHPYRWLRAIADHGGTMAAAPNFAYELCVRKTTPAQAETLDLSRWAMALNGAERVRKDTMERFARTFAVSGFRRDAFTACYGLAEATLMVSAGPRSAGIVSVSLQREALSGNVLVGAAETDATAAVTVGCGATAFGQQIAIVHPESGARAGDDEVGEIWVAGPCVARGYWKKPQETAATFDARIAGTGEGPFLRTGDLGFVHGGQLFITGRMKDVIIVRGRNHYAEDIEKTVAESHASLRPGGGVAFSVDGMSEEHLVVVHEAGADTADTQAVAEAIGRAVATHHQLRVDCVVLVRARTVPKTSSGKVQRRLCRTQFLEGRLDALGEWRSQSMSDGVCGDAHARPRPTGTRTETGGRDRAREATRIRNRLVAGIAEIRGVPTSGIDVGKAVTAYGLDSAEIAMLTADIEDWLGAELPVAVVWDHPTIETLAQALAGMPARERQDG